MNREEMIKVAAEALDSAPCTCPVGLSQHGPWRKVSPDCPHCGDSEAIATHVIDAVLGAFWKGGLRYGPDPEGV